MRVNRWSAVVAAWVALMLPIGGAHAQTDEEKAAARSLAKQGAEAFAAGRHAETLDLMTRAEAIVHAPPHVLYIARSQAALGKLVAARESYLKVIREELAATAPRAFKDAQQQAKAEVGPIEARIASLRIVLNGPGASKVNVKLDGQPVPTVLVGVHRPIDPGKHVVTAYPIGLSPVEQTVELADAEKKDVTLTIPAGGAASGAGLDPVDDPDAQAKGSADAKTPSPWGSPLVIGGIAGAVLGVGGVVVGAVFTAKRGSLSDSASAKYDQAGCKPPSKATCTKAVQDEIGAIDSKAATAGTIGVAGLVAGGVLLAGGVTMLVLGLTAKPAEKPQSAWVTPWVAPTGAGAGLHIKF